MTLLKFELKQTRIAQIIWTGAISLLLLVCLLIFPDMKSQVEELNTAFSSMGGFTEAFGMDRLNMGDLMGFYGLECGNILGIGGAFFASYMGVCALSGEEKGRTAEFLLTHPVTRSRIVLEKLLRLLIQVLTLNAVSVLTSLAMIRLIGESFPAKEFFLLHAAYLLLQIEIASICFGISACLRQSGVGIGLGLAALFYFLNLIANLTEDARWLKYLTPFGYADAADILTDSALDPGLTALGLAAAVLGILAAFILYNRKDIAI